MIKLAKLIWAFAKADFNAFQYWLTLLWAGALLVLNYSLNLENSVIDQLPTNGLRFLGYLTLYSTAYYSTVWITGRFKPNSMVFRSKYFWIVSLTGLAVFSADSGFVFHKYLIDYLKPPAQLSELAWAMLSNGTQFFTIALPLFMTNRFLVINRNEKLGLNNREIDLRPFLWMLALIAPFVFFSAFESGLNNYYPTYRYSSVARSLGISPWLPAAAYEFLYGLDFFNVELTFRGFFVIGMATVLGREAVVPMAVFYCTIHFGKPAVEAISSIFGGYILGAIAYQTRSIWGGVIVHIGLAWMMELAAFVAKGMEN